MKYAVTLLQVADDGIALFKKSNPAAYKKLMQLLLELEEHPRTGTGKPEPLRGGNGNVYSRRITQKHRLLYEIHDETVTVLVFEVERHYGGK
jgi:toxin YoeB